MIGNCNISRNEIKKPAPHSQEEIKGRINSDVVVPILCLECPLHIFYHQITEDKNINLNHCTIVLFAWEAAIFISWQVKSDIQRGYEQV